MEARSCHRLRRAEPPKSHCEVMTGKGSISLEWVLDTTLCALAKVPVGPVAAGVKVDGLEGAVDAEGIAGPDLAEHLRWDERGGDGG